MDTLFSVDWKLLFLPDTSIPEIIIRGSVLYIVIFFIIRFIPNKQVGGVGMNDMLLIVLVASAATNALGGEHKSIVNGVILVSTVIFWSYLFNWAAYRSSFLHRVIHPKPKLLVKDGEIRQENMERELVTEEELIGKLRRQGLTDVKAVREAYVESDGQISVVKADSN
jgi:uncharacterized membrane protein YcaP (DUF421 family)